MGAGQFISRRRDRYSLRFSYFFCGNPLAGR